MESRAHSCFSRPSNDDLKCAGQTDAQSFCCSQAQDSQVSGADRPRMPHPLEIKEVHSEPESCNLVSSAGFGGMLSKIGGIFWHGCENVQPLRVIELPGGGNEGDSAALLEDHARRAPDDKVTAALMNIIKENPQVLTEHRILPASTPNCYIIDGREVRLEVAAAESVFLKWSGQRSNNGLGGAICRGRNSPVLVCQDSVMRQPFLDYVFNTGYNEWYEDLPGVSMSLDVPGIFKEYPETPPNHKMDRFDAMKLAHQQALERERTSFYSFGKPPDIVEKHTYEIVELPNFMPQAIAGGA